MMHIYRTLSLLACCLVLFHPLTAQSFSGKVTYRVHYEGKRGGYRTEFWNRYEGNYHIFYTDGCNQRTDYLFNDQLLQTILYRCDSGLSYLMYPEIDRVLQYDQQNLDRQFEIVSQQENVMDILGIACNRLIANYERYGRKGKVEYFFSSEHYLDDQVPLADNCLIREGDVRTAIPLAVVEGSRNTYRATEAIDVEPMALPDSTFALPESSRVVLNGLVLDTRPEPKRGYEWWFGKLQRSVRYPSSARKDLATGRVNVMFTITEEGKIKDIEVVNEVDEVFKRRVLTFLHDSLAKWKPGQVDGKPVSSTLVMPVSFQVFP